MWLPLSLICAVCTSTYFLLNKQLTKSLSITTFLFISNLCTLVFMFIMIMLMGGFPHVTSKFYLLMFISSLLDLVSFAAYTYALKHYPISLLAPMGAFIPVIATLLAIFTLHEIPTPLKLFGILVIVTGAYLLHLSDAKLGLLTPFKKLFTNRGVQLYSVMIVLYGIAPSIQKPAIFETHPTTPLFASFFGVLLVTIYFGIYSIPRIGKETKSISKKTGIFLLYGFLYAIGQLTSYLAFAMAHVGYVTALFELSVLFNIFLGGFLLKEQRIKERLLGAIVMIAGVILLAI